MATQELVLTSPESRALTPMDLLSTALSKDAAIDVIERLAKLQLDFMQKDAEQRFNDALNQAQADIGRIAPDSNNPQTKSKYASYAALDRVLRPIYIRYGFSLSFNTAEGATPDTMIVLCDVSHRAGHVRQYRVPMPTDGKGAKGGDVMTKTHATGSAFSYGMRYLLKAIFNVAIGQDDNDGNGASLPMPDDKLVEFLDGIKNANNVNELKAIYMAASKAAGKNEEYQQRFAREKNTRYRQIVTRDGGR